MRGAVLEKDLVLLREEQSGQLEPGGGQKRPPKFCSIITDKRRSCGLMLAIKEREKENTHLNESAESYSTFVFLLLPFAE